MTRHDTLTCVHEPFGDAFYYGPERLSDRYETDEKERVESGFSDSTFKTILDRIEREGSEVRSFFPTVTVLADEPSTFPCHTFCIEDTRYSTYALSLPIFKRICYFSSSFIFAAIFTFSPPVFDNPARVSHIYTIESNESTGPTTLLRSRAK